MPAFASNASMEIGAFGAPALRNERLHASSEILMVKVSVREASGNLAEWEDDDSLLARLAKLQEQGVFGRALIAQIVEVNSDLPPLSVRLSGVDSAGVPFEKFICCD